jgi:hypothetical protein
MTTITLEHHERVLLTAMLDQRLRDLAIQVRHTDSRRFRSLLHQEVDALRAIRARLEVEDQRAG